MKKLFILILILASSQCFAYFQTKIGNADTTEIRLETIHRNGGYVGGNANE